MLKTHTAYSLIALLLLAISYPQHLFAQTDLAALDSSLGDEDLFFGDIPSVFSASKYEQKITEAPARISIVTADEIRHYGYRTLLEVLNSLPGFQISYDRSYSYVGVRGFAVPGDFNTRVLVLVDGHRMNENIYDGVLVDYGSVIDIDLIERVEVVRGPSSSLYGSSAFFGVINIITKKGRDIQGAEVSVSTGSQASNKLRLSYGNRLENGLEMLISASAYETDGDNSIYYAEFDDPETNNGIAQDADAATSDNFYLKLAYEEFTLVTSYEEYDEHFPTGSYEILFNDPRAHTLEGHAYVNLKYQHLLENGADVTARLFYDDYWYDGFYPYNYAEAGDPPDEVVFNEEARGNWWGAELQVIQQFFDNHRMTFGFEYRNSLHEKQLNYDIYDVYMDSDENSTVTSLFLQDEFRLSDNVILNMGLRFDDFSTFGNNTNPRLAAIWNPQQSSTVKFLYGTAFRAPNAYELYFEDGGISQKAPESLDSETIESYEIILEQKFNENLNLVASLYRNNIEDLLALDTDPADDLLVFVNIDKATAEGIELELQGHWQDGRSGSVSYSYQQSEDDSGSRLVNTPRNMVKFNLTVPVLNDSFNTGVELIYESGRKTLGGDQTDARVITNLTLFNANWVDNMKLSASVYNLMDEDYSDPGFEEHEKNQLVQDGRTFRLKLDYLF